MALSLYQAFWAETWGSKKSSSVYMAISTEMVPSLNHVTRRKSASIAGDGHDPSLLRVFCLQELKDFCSKASHCQSMVSVTAISYGYRDPAQVFKQTGCSVLESKTWAPSRCIITAFSAAVHLNTWIQCFFNRTNTGVWFTGCGRCWWGKRTCLGGWEGRW